MSDHRRDPQTPEVRRAECDQLSYLRAAIAASGDGVIIVDARGQQVAMNEAGRRITGQAPALGPPATQTCPARGMEHGNGQTLRPGETPLARALHGEAVTDLALVLRGTGNHEVHISASAWPLRDEQSGISGAIAVYRDVTAQRQLQEALRRRESELETLMANLPDIISRVDRDLRFTFASPNSERISGLPTSAFLGRTVRETGFFTEDVANLSDTFNRRAFETGRVQAFGYDVATPLGLQYFRIRIVPEFDAAGNVVSLLTINQNITPQKQAQVERERLLASERQAREEAEAALRARDEFLAVAAHELKTPVTNLRGHAELAVRRIDSGRITDVQQVRPTLQTMDRQADRLAMLAGRLLDLSELERGELVLRRQVTDLAALARRMVETMQAGTTRNRITYQGPAELWANVDPERLREVLYHLIDNAIKYSPRGGPVEVALSEPDPQTVSIAVHDYGPGIPPEQRAQLFTRFFKAGVERPASGLGLGLFVGQRLVALHGGALTAEFPEDGGSRFVVTLPRDL